MSATTSETETRGKLTDPGGFDLDACQDEVRPIPDRDFEAIQLEEYLYRSV